MVPSVATEKIPSDTTGNRSRDRPTSSAVPFMSVSSWILLRMRNVSNKICREYDILCSITVFFRISCRLWDVEKYGTAGQAADNNIIQRKRFACWITKATNTISQYLLLISYARQQLFRERVSMLRHSTLPVFSWLLIDGSGAALLPNFRMGLGSDLEWDLYSCDIRSVFRHLQVKFILLPLPFSVFLSGAIDQCNPRPDVIQVSKAYL